MSDQNRDRKRTARERIRQQQQRDERRARRQRTLTAVGVALAVVAVVATVGALVAHQSGNDSAADGPDRPAVAPRGAVGEHKTVIPVGPADAKAVISVFEDFRCPACGQFEKAFGETIDSLVDDGKARAEYSIVSFIDNNVRGTGSRKAANAAACAQNEGAFEAYHRVLYANQPTETEDAFGNRDRLVELADEVPALKGNRAFRSCVEKDRFADWVSSVQKEFNDSGHTSTPTVLLNGKKIFPGDEQLTPKRLTELVTEANKR